MPYEITATRKRPQDFAGFKGQEFVSATLEASLASGRIAHAYLFSGPRGTGKTSAARILAKALNCETGPTPKPCGTCHSCVEIARGASLDVIEIDGASNTSVDNVRQIKDEVLFPPNGGHYKVYIIDEVHMLSNSAFNALLKTIEEPPPYIIFIFATTELHKVPATIKSRCQQFAFRLFGIELIKSLLSEAAGEIGVQADEEALLWIAKEAGGSLRDAYTLFDQVVSFSEGRLSAALIRDKLGLVGLDALNDLFRACAAGDAAQALEALDGILERGVAPEQFVIDATEYFRSLLLLKHGIAKASLLGSPPTAFDQRVLEALDAERIERALACLLELYRDLRFTVDLRFELELVVARLCRLREFVSPVDLSRAVGALRRYVAGEGAAPAPPAPPAEKKKPELPPTLSAAFGSLAMAAEAAAMDDRRPAADAPEAPGNAAPAGDEFMERLRHAVVDAVGRSSPLLQTGLSASLTWRVEDGRLIIPFRSGIEESVVRGSIADIAAAAATAGGKTYKVELRVERLREPHADAAREAGPGLPAEAFGATAAVAAVERVFRGTRVGPAEGGGIG